MSRRLDRSGLPLLLALALQACGGGGGGSKPPPPPPVPPVTLSYAAPPAFTRGTAIVSINPTVSGGPNNFTVSPALPPGLTLDAGTGAIAGTPTDIRATATYQITARNSANQAIAPIAITVNDVAPVFSYSKAAHALSTDAVIAPIVPTVTAGTVVLWSIDATLPAGLAFNAATGQITGTPTQPAAAAPFVITAQNSGGTATFNLSISVQNGTLLDLGHASAIARILHDGSRVLSEDADGTAVLWNAQTGEKILRVDDCAFNPTRFCFALANGTAAFATDSGFDLRAASDGALRAHIDFDVVYWWSLSPDASYLCSGSPTGLTCWSGTNGSPLFTRAGDYRNAMVVAANGELRIARGAAGAQIIEKLAMPSGTSTTTPAFPGTFHSWFHDGARFLTTAGNTVAVYGTDGVQIDIATLPTLEKLGGNRDWFYTARNGAFDLYRVGASATPEATYAFAANSGVVASTGTIAILPPDTQPVRVVDVSGANPALVTFAAPRRVASNFGAHTINDWAIGVGTGVLMGELTGTPQRYSLGAVHSITGAPTRFAVATNADVILVYDSQTRTLETTLDLLDAGQLQLSDDGTRLSAGPGRFSSSLSSDRTLRIYELPSKAVLAEWPSVENGAGWILDHAFSADGNVVGRVQIDGIWTTTVSGTPLWNGPRGVLDNLRLSPDGMKFALTKSGGDRFSNTDIYTNGVLTAAAAQAWAVGWLSDSQLLLNRYVHRDRVPNGVFDGSVILNPAGQALSTPALAELEGMVQRLSATTLYSSFLNSILDVPTGDTLWSTTTDSRGKGAVAGDYVVFTSGSVVRSEVR